MLCLDTVCVSIPVAMRVFGSQCVLNFKMKSSVNAFLSAVFKVAMNGSKLLQL